MFRYLAAAALKRSSKPAKRFLLNRFAAATGIAQVAASSSTPSLSTPAAGAACSHCDQIRRYRTWRRAALSALLSYLVYRWYCRHHDDDYPYLHHKTYPTPIQPSDPDSPPLHHHADDPPAIFRIELLFPAPTAATVSHTPFLIDSWVTAASALAALFLSTSASCQTSLEGADPPHWHRWPHEGPVSAFDTAALRRGFEVYRQVCSACHSLQWIHFRQLVGVTHTEEQAKALARSVVVMDGLDDEGNVYERPGTLADSFPPPYPNEEFARFVNNGASDKQTVPVYPNPALSVHLTRG